MGKKIAHLMLYVSLRMPTWVYGRKALLDLSLMYLIINNMRKVGKLEA